MLKRPLFMNIFSHALVLLALPLYSFAVEDTEPSPSPESATNVTSEQVAPNSEIASSTSEQPVKESEALPVPENIARVGDEYISSADMAREMSVQLRQMQQAGVPVPPEDQFRKSIMEQLIFGKLLTLAAKADGITIEDEEFLTEFQVRRAGLPTEQAFQDYLKQEQLTEDTLKEKLRERLMQDKFMEKIAKDISVDEEEIREHYDRLLSGDKLSRKGRTYDIAQILLRPASTDVEEWMKTKEELTAIRQRILAGENFQDMAREFSQDPQSAPHGGVYYEVFPDQLPPVLAHEVEDITVGGVSEPLRGPGGWHLLTLLRRNEPGVIPIEKAQGRIYDLLFESKKQAAVQEVLLKVRENENIKVFTVSEPLEVDPAPEEPKTSATTEDS
jgi:peptidyl-prolyl cis-trans isomerase SurA